VDSPCDYRVLSLNPAKRNELLSSITIKLTADDAAVLELTKDLNLCQAQVVGARLLPGSDASSVGTVLLVSDR